MAPGLIPHELTNGLIPAPPEPQDIRRQEWGSLDPDFESPEAQPARSAEMQMRKDKERALSKFIPKHFSPERIEAWNDGHRDLDPDLIFSNSERRLLAPRT